MTLNGIISTINPHINVNSINIIPNIPPINP